jgi:hypothetical protein
MIQIRILFNEIKIWKLMILIKVLINIINELKMMKLQY